MSSEHAQRYPLSNLSAVAEKNQAQLTCNMRKIPFPSLTFGETRISHTDFTQQKRHRMNLVNGRCRHGPTGLTNETLVPVTAQLGCPSGEVLYSRELTCAILSTRLSKLNPSKREWTSATPIISLGPQTGDFIFPCFISPLPIIILAHHLSGNSPLFFPLPSSPLPVSKKALWHAAGLCLG